MSLIGLKRDLLGLEKEINSPKRYILDYSKLKEFADDKFKFDEYDRKFFKRVENTVGKGEIARCKLFLLFSQWFQKTCSRLLQSRKNKGLFGNELGL